MMHFEDGIKHIFPKDFIKIYDRKDIKIIDVREPYELEQLPFENAINIPTNLILTQYSSFLKKEESYYILCHHGQRSYLVTEVLTNNGYDVINIVGGLDLVNRFDNLNK